MVERKLYKTKICLLYQRGRCSRQYCNFAHGDAELRRSFNEWIMLEFRGSGDLRERLDRMRSPLPDSPGRRDAKARQTSHGDSPRSLGKRIDRNERKRKHMDGHNDYSGRMSDGTEDQIKDRRFLLDAQLREMHSEIKLLEDDKQQMEMYLEDKVKEADSLTFKIHELEVQLSKEKEDGKRLTTKIKKFIKAHNRHSRLEDELKRSQGQLQKLGEQLDLEVGGGNEDNSKFKALSDDANGGFASPLNEGQLNHSPRRKRSHVSVEAQDASNQVGGKTEVGKIRLEKPHRSSRNHEHIKSNSKKSEVDGDTYDSRGLLAHEENSRRGFNLPVDADSADKSKALETGLTLPSTGIAAHAIDDVEAVEMDDRFRVTVGPSSEANAQEDTSKAPRLPFLPPPPPIPQNAYLQYKGDDENVDVDGADEETVEVDIV